MSEELIQLMKPNIGNDEIELVKEVIDSGYLVEGPKVREFEELIKSYLNVKHAISCTSWTTGAEMVFRAIGLEEGDEVICPDFTHPATALAVITAGGTPVLVDVDLESRNTTAEIISEALTDKTKAIQPVSIFGNPVDVDPINSLAKEKNLFVVDDAACTLGSEYKGKPVGSLVDFTIFSFHPRKVFTCGDGGLITTNNDNLAERLQSMKVFGAENGKFKNWGTNQRMSNVHGALLLGQIRRLEEIVNDRIQKAKVYNKLLKDVNGIKIPKIDKHSKSNYQTYAVFLERDNIRNEIIKKMREKNIQTQIGTYAIHKQPFLESVKTVGNLANSYKLQENLLSLPLHYALSARDQERVVFELVEILSNI